MAERHSTPKKLAKKTAKAVGKSGMGGECGTTTRPSMDSIPLVKDHTVSPPIIKVKTTVELQNPASSPERVEEEQDEDDSTTFKKLEVKHPHSFKFQFRAEQNIVHPPTVLEALKTNHNYNARQYSDENVIITLSRAKKQVAIATHFPCHWIKKNDVLVIHHKLGKGEAKPPQGEGEYVAFFIDKEGGENAKGTPLFRENTVKPFDLCVYAKKGMTVGEAFQRDGRFYDGLDKFKLSDNDDPDRHIEQDETVDNLNGKFFKICVDPKK